MSRKTTKKKKNSVHKGLTPSLEVLKLKDFHLLGVGGAGRVVSRRADGESNTVARQFDEVDDAAVVQRFDVHAIHGQNTVTQVQFAASLGGTAFYYAA